MQKLVVILSSFFLFTTMACAREEVAIPLSKETQQKIIRKYTEEFMDYARLVPIICDDSETYWAVREIKKIADRTDTNNIPFITGLTNIFEMQAYSAYGMGYFTAITGLYESPDEAGYLLHAIQNTKEDRAKIEEQGYSDIVSIFKFGDMSYFYTQLYARITNLHYEKTGEEPPFHQPGYGCSIRHSEMIDSLARLGTSPQVLFKTASILENVSFFQSFCPMANTFCPAKDHHEQQKGIIMEMAMFFDRTASPVYKAFSKNPSKMDVYTDDEFEKIMLKSFEYKKALLKILVRNIWGIRCEQVAEQRTGNLK